ncbi:MAG: hypothetical protein K8R60_05000 [Burkholderiales bacterium]|nr:hypothetical protein [Burkholderiales bacterium]
MNAALVSRSPDEGASAPERRTEFSYGSADFERVRTLIYRKAGISLHARKQAMVYSRLSRRLRDLGHGSFAQAG